MCSTGRLNFKISSIETLDYVFTLIRYVHLMPYPEYPGNTSLMNDGL